MKPELKDWQIAQVMFGKNTKNECKIVSDLRKHGETNGICDCRIVDYLKGYNKELFDKIHYYDTQTFNKND